MQDRIEMKTVSSSMIDSVGYNAKNQKLAVRFRNKSLYYYFDVPVEHYRAMTDGGVSVGSYFINNIKNSYRYVKA